MTLGLSHYLLIVAMTLMVAITTPMIIFANRPQQFNITIHIIMTTVTYHDRVYINNIVHIAIQKNAEK